MFTLTSRRLILALLLLPAHLLAGEPLFTESFTTAVNAKGNPIQLSATTAFALTPDGWFGTNLYVAARTSGVIQLSARDKPGWLLTPPLVAQDTAGSLSLVLHAAALDHTSESLSVLQIDGPATNLLGTLSVPKGDLTFLSVPLAALAPTTRFLLTTDSNAKEQRIALSSVRLWQDYAEGDSERYEADHQNESSDGDSEPTADDNATLAATCPLWWQDAFLLKWQGIRSSVHVTVFTNREATVLWSETFSNAKTRSNTAQLKLDEFRQSYVDNNEADWMIERVYAPPEDGAIRLGTTKATGTLTLPPTDALSSHAGSLFLRFRARTADDSALTRHLPLTLFDPTANTTNELATVSVTADWSTQTVTLPSDLGAQRIQFHSITNTIDGRTLIDSIELLAGSGEGQDARDILAELDVEDADRCVVTDLPRAVVSVLIDPASSGTGPEGNAVELTVDLRTTAAFPLKRLSPFLKGTGPEDFAFVRSISGRSAWVNGLTLTGWHAFINGEAETDVLYDSGQENIASLYASYNDDIQSLSILSGRDKQTELLLYLINDSDRTVQSFDLKFDAFQWSFPTNAPAQTQLLCQYQTVSGPFEEAEESAWHPLDACTFTAVQSDGSDQAPHRATRQADAVPCRLEPGQMLLLKWFVPSGKPNLPMIGLADLSLSFSVKERGLALHLQ